MTPSGTEPGRQRTQWTGSLQVPVTEEARPAQKSKLPMIIGGVLVAGAAAAAVFFATRGSKGDPGPGSGSPTSSGSNPVVVQPPPPDAATVTPPPALPENAEITIETEPDGADVIDVMTKVSRGTTPTTFTVQGSTSPRQFEVKKKGYKSLVIELTPNKPKLATFHHVLVKGVGTQTVVKAGSAVTPPGPGSQKPDPGPGSQVVVKPPDPVGSGTGSAKAPPVVDPPDCDEPGACIKTNLKKACTAKTDCPSGLDCIDGFCK
jgi:hypothetical protein